MDKFDFTDKVAIVTGAGGGIGQAVSLELAKSGAKVVVVDLMEETGMSTVRQITEIGGEAIFVKTDVTKEEDIKNYVNTTINKYNKIDVLLNNAGWLGEVAPLVDYKTDVFEKVMRINVSGVFLGMKYVLPHMIQRKSGAIVNTASTAGIEASPNVIAYGASKHAVIGMTKTAGIEAAPHGVRVNCVIPGAVEHQTSMIHDLETGNAKVNAEELEIQRRARLKAYPNGRYAEPQDIANMMMFLASDLSSHIIGAQYIVDGGKTVI